MNKIGGIPLNFSQNQIQISKNLAKFAPVYQNAILKIDQNENWKKQFNENDNGNYIALQFFLEHFAYERNVKPKSLPRNCKTNY